MRRQAALVCLAVLAVLLPLSGASADEPKIEESSPIAQLRAIGFPFECHKLHELGSVDSRDETDPDEVEYIKLGDSQVAIIVVSGVPDDARTSLRYYFLDGLTTLTVPASKHLAHIRFTECATLDTLRLDGLYPNLKQLELLGVDRLRYLSAPYRGDAPQLEYPTNSHWGTNLNALRLLKLPGTAIGNKPVVLRTDPRTQEPIEVPRFPPGIVEVDLRDTPIGDDWLPHLAKLHRRKVLRIGECKNLTDEAKEKFCETRPDVKVDEKTVHRPMAS